MNEPSVGQCPELSKIKKANKRLVDTGLLHHEASLAGNSERYRRGETSHTIHVWWARRPHTAMRALTYATVCKSTSRTNVNIMNDLSSSREDDDIIQNARKENIKGLWPYSKSFGYVRRRRNDSLRSTQSRP